MGINESSPQWPKKVFDKNLETLPLTQKQELFMRINNQPMNYTGSSIKHLKNAKYTHLFEIIFGVLTYRVLLKQNQSSIEIDVIVVKKHAFPLKKNVILK